MCLIVLNVKLGRLDCSNKNKNEIVWINGIRNCIEGKFVNYILDECVLVGLICWERIVFLDVLKNDNNVMMIIMMMC